MSGREGRAPAERDELVMRANALAAELQHRTLNLMAVVQALANETALSSASIDEFRLTFSARLRCLARVQGLLSRIDRGEEPSLADLLEGELAALGASPGDLISMEGPTGLWLRSSAMSLFALALHELAAEAVRRGALSIEEGRLSIKWRYADDDGRSALWIEWTETGVPTPKTAPEPFSFRRDLIEEALPFQIGARTTYDVTSDGVRCVIVLRSADAAG